MRFVLASGNRHKLGEFAAILAPHEVVAMPAGIELPPEGTESFVANARVKALALRARPCSPTQRWRRAARAERLDDVLFFADDSGLEVEALGWAPGVTSARYAGVDGPGADRANSRASWASSPALGAGPSPAGRASSARLSRSRRGWKNTR